MVSKLLLASVPPTMMAAFLYLGAGAGMLAVGAVRRTMEKEPSECRLTRKDLPYTVGMIVLDIAAPIFLMIGLSTTASANVSLLNNFEIVATSLIALLIFKEAISRRLWLAIGMITLSSMVLSIEDTSSFHFSIDEYLDEDGRSKDVEFVRFKKFYQRFFKQTDYNYMNWVNKRAGTKNLFIIGHSLAMTDKNVLRDILFQPGVQTTIFYHNKEANANQITNLV